MNFKKLVYNTSLLNFVLSSYFLFIVSIVIPFEIIKTFFQVKLGGSDLNNTDIYLKFFIVVLMGPFVETLVFQIGIIKLITYFFPKYKIISVVFSAIMFGLSHFYSIYYVIYTTLMGLFFAMLYYISKKRNNSPLLVIFLVHAMYNFTVFILKEF